MKDILFEKHREILMENCEFIDGQIRGLIVHGAIEKATNTTKEIAKGFAEWLAGNVYVKTVSGWVSTEPMDFNPLTTEELLEKYLETLHPSAEKTKNNQK